MTQGEESHIVFAVGLGSAIGIVCLSRLLQAFGHWRLRHARMNDRVRCVRIAGAAVIAETVFIAQSANMSLFGARKAGFSEMAVFLDSFLPVGLTSTVSLALAMTVMGAFWLLFGEMKQVMRDLASSLPGRTNRAGSTG